MRTMALIVALVCFDLAKNSCNAEEPVVSTHADVKRHPEVDVRDAVVSERQQTFNKQAQVISNERDFDAHQMLAGRWVPEDPHAIDFEMLPRLRNEHVVVNSVRGLGGELSKVEKSVGGVNQHNYLVHHQNQFWIMWSDGPGVEDRVGQRVKFATSIDGQAWSSSAFLTPEPPGSGPNSEFYGTRSEKGFRWIARGFWKRNNELLALASLDEAAGFFGPSLELHAFRWSQQSLSWDDQGVISKNTINNFPPERLPDGRWMMSRRKYDYKTTGVHFLVGGVDAVDHWDSFPVLDSSSELAAEEPLWWVLPDNRVLALFRDNRHSGYLFRSFSVDAGRTWSTPVKTNFPDATSKLHGLRLRDGRYILVSNANPKKRDPLVLSVSHDGVTFTQMGYLIGGRHVDYPHVMEFDKHLLVAFAGGKQSVEIVRLKIDELTADLNHAQPVE